MVVLFLTCDKWMKSCAMGYLLFYNCKKYLASRSIKFNLIFLAWINESLMYVIMTSQNLMWALTRTQKSVGKKSFYFLSTLSIINDWRMNECLPSHNVSIWITSKFPMWRDEEKVDSRCCLTREKVKKKVAWTLIRRRKKNTTE